MDIISSGWDDRVGKRMQEVVITFVTDSDLPADGSIEIIWPNEVPKAYPHCRSLVSAGSALFALGGTENGEIGCMVQHDRNWVITGFQALAG